MNKIRKKGLTRAAQYIAEITLLRLTVYIYKGNSSSELKLQSFSLCNITGK